MRVTRGVIAAAASMGLAIVFAGTARAVSERFEDLPASVEVAQVFGVEVTRSNLVFENAQPGRETIIGDGGTLNQVTCRSNTGRPWYLNAQVRSLSHLQQSMNLPAGSLKWRLVTSTGQGEMLRGEFRGFSDEPSVIYTAAGDDLRGRLVELKFEYSLAVPSDAPAGTYVGQLVFTMAE